MPAGSGEPVVDEWTEVGVDAVLDQVGVLGRQQPMVLAVNGRSGAGKSTLATRLLAAAPAAALVATDDVAWHYSRFDWAAELITAAIEPVRRGRPVHYRPPGWVLKNRPGAVIIEPGTRLLIIEGVGSSQRALGEMIDAAIWVQSDAEVARERGIARDAASGVNGDHQAATAFWDEWAAEEEPFLAADAPWSRADMIMAGVPAVLESKLCWQASAGTVPTTPPLSPPRTL